MGSLNTGSGIGAGGVSSRVGGDSGIGLGSGEGSSISKKNQSVCRKFFNFLLSEKETE